MDFLQYMKHFQYATPAQPLGPEDFAWRMVKLTHPNLWGSNSVICQKCVGNTVPYCQALFTIEAYQML